MKPSILIFEWLNGGGLWTTGDLPSPNCPFQNQGRQMLLALAEDFHQLGCSVHALWDTRFEPSPPFIKPLPMTRDSQLSQALTQAAKEVDSIILIAPESDGLLSQCCDWLEPYRHKMISPNREFVELTSNKSGTIRHLRTKGIPVPPAWEFEDRHHQYVVKPNDGAGSEDIRIVNWAEAKTYAAQAQWHVEPYMNGKPASIGIIQSDSTYLFPPVWQNLDSQCGPYRNCERILEPELIEAIQACALDVAEALPTTKGYFGIDLIVDAVPTVIEINPRLTTSYCQTHRWCSFNPAQKMLQ